MHQYPQAQATDTPPTSWHGKLDLVYSQRHGSTQLHYNYGQAPLKVQRPFYPEGPSVCHSVILHTAGGVVGGDRLSLNVKLEPAAQVLLTTAAAGKVYRSRDRSDPVATEARQTIQIQVGEGACLEWFPQETIVFDGAVYRQDLRVELAASAIWMGWELTRLGRSARGEQFLQGNWRSRTEVWRQGRPLWIDPQWIEGNPTIFHSPHGLASQPVVGSFAVIGRTVTPDLVEQARQLWVHSHKTGSTGGEVGVTRLLEGMLCRYRGPLTLEARNWFMQVWHLIRLSWLEKPACSPRVWPS